MNVQYFDKFSQDVANNIFSAKLYYMKNGKSNETDLGVINAWTVMETFTEDIKNQYSSLYELMLGGTLEQLNTFLSGMIQTPILTDAMFRQIWVKPEVMEFPIELIFYAQDDAFKDVYLPVRTLQIMGTPKLGTSIRTLFEGLVQGIDAIPLIGGFIGDAYSDFVNKLAPDFLNANFMGPPGYIGNNRLNLYKIQIGNFIELSNLLLRNISVEWNTSDMQEIYDPVQGKNFTFPLSARVKLELISEFNWTTQTIENLIAFNSTGDTERFVNMRREFDVTDVLNKIRSVMGV